MRSSYAWRFSMQTDVLASNLLIHLYEAAYHHCHNHRCCCSLSIVIITIQEKRWRSYAVPDTIVVRTTHSNRSTASRVTQSGTQDDEYDNRHSDDMRHAESEGRASAESGGHDGSCRQRALREHYNDMNSVQSPANHDVESSSRRHALQEQNIKRHNSADNAVAWGWRCTTRRPKWWRQTAVKTLAHHVTCIEFLNRMTQAINSFPRFCLSRTAALLPWFSVQWRLCRR